MTFNLGSKDGQPFIECNVCTMKSYNPMDIKHRYCGKCRKFHPVSVPLAAPGGYVTLEPAMSNQEIALLTRLGQKT